MTPLEILKAARAKIESPESWGKGRRGAQFRSLVTCCAAEAIEEGAPWGDYDGRRKAYEMLSNAAGLDEQWGEIVNWNDAPERTHAEVLAAFDLAIALERNMPRSRKARA